MITWYKFVWYQCVLYFPYKILKFRSRDYIILLYIVHFTRNQKNDSEQIFAYTSPLIHYKYVT